MACFLLWRLFRAPGSKHIATAPTERQLRRVTFSEIATIVNGSSFLSKMMEVGGLKVNMKKFPEWMVFGAAASDENALRGAHHPEMVGAVEELTGVPDSNIQTVRRTLSQDNNCFVSIFNPDKINGAAYDMFHGSRHEWPWNFTIDKIALSKANPDLVSPTKIEEIRREFGEDSPQWMIGVLGEFPTQGLKNVIPLGLWNQTQGLMPSYVVATSEPARVIGVDFAMGGQGADENCAAVRNGNAITELITRHMDADDFADLTMEIPWKYGWGKDCVFVVDEIGMGATLVNTYRKRGYYVEGFRPNRKSPVRGYKDWLTAGWMNLRQKIKYQQVYLPSDDALEQQLITREFDRMGDNMVVESKLKYVGRGFKSPDRADAVIHAFSPVMDLNHILSAGSFRRRKQAVFEKAQRTAPTFNLFKD